MESAMNVAKYIVTKCVNDGTPINNTQLQKILYFVQRRYLRTTGEPLFPENFEAWRLGPVIPDVYYAFCGYGVMKINQKYKYREIPACDRSLIDKTVEIYKVYSIAAIVWFAQNDGGVWREVYGENGEGLRATIPMELIHFAPDDCGMRPMKQHGFQYRGMKYE